VDLILDTRDTTRQSINSLQQWVDSRGHGEALRDAVALLLCDLRAAKPVTMRTEGTEGFANPETATVARILDNSHDHFNAVAQFVADIDIGGSSVTLAECIAEYVEGNFTAAERVEVGSLWRVDWRQIARHVSTP
jgi:hypothetical protein